jgi:HNH endonuclease
MRVRLLIWPLHKARATTPVRPFTSGQGQEQASFTVATNTRRLSSAGLQRLMRLPIPWLTSTARLRRIDMQPTIEQCGNGALVHRVVFALFYGYFPKEVDHINGIPSDNRPSNLREVTRSQNNMNKRMQSNNTSGYRGVYWVGPKCLWHARIKVNRKSVSLKYHKTLESAVSAYAAASKLYHGEHARGAY